MRNKVSDRRAKRQLRNLKLVRIEEQTARPKRQPARDPIQAAARSRLAILADPTVSYLEASDQEQRMEKLIDILSEGVYAHLKKKGLARKQSPPRGKEN